MIFVFVYNIYYLSFLVEVGGADSTFHVKSLRSACVVALITLGLHFTQFKTFYFTYVTVCACFS